MPEVSAFGPNLWIIDGPPVRDMGVMFTTRMTVVKLSDGGLWVNSPVAVASDTLERIVELGPVRYLVAATPRHVWRLGAWHALFPEAQLWVPPKTAMTLQQGELSCTEVLGDAPPPAWAVDLDQLAFQGNRLIEEIFFFHQLSRTVILDDLIQIHPLPPGRPVRNALLKLAGVAAPDGGVPPDIRLTFTSRKLARRSLARLLAWDFDKLVVAHGACIEHDAKALVERAFRWLVQPAAAKRGRR